MALALMIGTGTLLLSFPSLAQTLDETLEEEADTGFDIAPVIVDGEDLFTVVGVSAHPATERAGDIARRIVEAAEKEGRGTPSFRIQQTDSGPAIYIHDIHITTVTQVDVDFEAVGSLSGLCADVLDRFADSGDEGRAQGVERVKRRHDHRADREWTDLTQPYLSRQIRIERHAPSRVQEDREGHEHQPPHERAREQNRGDLEAHDVSHPHQRRDDTQGK